jgi:hypothetical protein
MIYETYNDFVIVITIHETYNDLMNRYNDLERIVVGSTEQKRYNNSSNRYTFHKLL